MPHLCICRSGTDTFNPIKLFAHGRQVLTTILRNDNDILQPDSSHGNKRGQDVQVYMGTLGDAVLFHELGRKVTAGFDGEDHVLFQTSANPEVLEDVRERSRVLRDIEVFRLEQLARIVHVETERMTEAVWVECLSQASSDQFIDRSVFENAETEKFFGQGTMGEKVKVVPVSADLANRFCCLQNDDRPYISWRQLLMSVHLAVGTLDLPFAS